MLNKLNSITVAELIAKLQKLGPEALELPVIGISGSSGVSYEIGSPHRTDLQLASIDGGPLIDMPEGTPYVSLYLGN